MPENSASTGWRRLQKKTLTLVAIALALAPVNRRAVFAESAPIQAIATVISPLGANGTVLLAPCESSVYIILERQLDTSWTSFANLPPSTQTSPVATVPLAGILESFGSIGESASIIHQRQPAVLTFIYTEN